MTRYGPGHKQATRRRMIETAGRRLKSDGIDGAGIATLVADAGADQRRVLRALRLEG